MNLEYPIDIYGLRRKIFNHKKGNILSLYNREKINKLMF